MDRGACQATVYRVTKSWTQLSTHNNNKGLSDIIQFSLTENSGIFLNYDLLYLH